MPRHDAIPPNRRRGYYGSPAPASGTETATLCGAPEPVQGAKAIAELLKLDPRKGTRQVFRLIEAHRGRADAPPIENLPGLGLVADRQTLLDWWSRRLTGH